MADIPTILDEIIQSKREEVGARRARVDAETMKARALSEPPARDFVGSLTAPLGDLPCAIIAEIKRKSPSAGWIRPEYEPAPGGEDVFKPEAIARQYQQAGARAISCLTDEDAFAGRLSYLKAVRAACTLPVLRKDFMIDPWQVFESRAAGADAILLIAECLDDDQIREMIRLAVDLGMGVLLESHDEANLDRSVRLADETHPEKVLIGINNRDLRVMRVDLGHSARLADRVPRKERLVSESGIGAPADLGYLRDHGIRIALVGERLMATDHPGNALAALLGRQPEG